MSKLMKQIMTVALASLLLCTSSVFADEIPTGNTETSDEATVVLYSEGTSSYSVQLPKSVDVTNETSTFTIKAKGNIAGDEKIMVTVPTEATLIETDDQGVDLTTGAHDDIELTIAYDKSSSGYAFSDINVDDYNGTNATGTVTITHTGVKIPAGHWRNNLSISISLVGAADSSGGIGGVVDPGWEGSHGGILD